MIYARVPSFFGLGLEDGHVLIFWRLLCGEIWFVFDCSEMMLGLTSTTHHSWDPFPPMAHVSTGFEAAPAKCPT